MSNDIFLTNNLSNKKEKFVPLDEKNIGMYVCGPTVYDDPHIGNARPIVIFDILFKILKKKFSNVTYVGASAFSHKGGMHVSAVQKNPKTYEHIDPEEVGNSRNIVVSDQAGQSNIMSRLKSIGIQVEKNDPKIKKLLEE
ncbi:hypothetical protein OA524_01970, partial [Candidatus Pelagibacter sp.]|nr:hypothetical protein [Candidatus Pelagibacter sp.]